MSRDRKKKPVTLAGSARRPPEPVRTLAPDEGPTPERLMQAGVTVAIELGTRRTQIVGRGPDMPLGADGVIRLTDAPLDRLANRDRLDEKDPERNRQLFEAGHVLRNHYFLGGLSGFAANDLNGGGGGGHPANRTPITETMEKNRRALRRAEAAMDPGDWSVIADIVCREITLEEAGRRAGYDNKNYAIAVGLDRLRRGLGQLAELWGYSPPKRPSPKAQVTRDIKSTVAA